MIYPEVQTLCVTLLILRGNQPQTRTIIDLLSAHISTCMAPPHTRISHENTGQEVDTIDDLHDEDNLAILFLHRQQTRLKYKPVMTQEQG